MALALPEILPGVTHWPPAKVVDLGFPSTLVGPAGPSPSGEFW